jgi:hypothetical protein
MALQRINKLISFGKSIDSEFVKHIQNTDNLCLYKLGSHHIPSNIIFPNAKTITLINCNRAGILNIFKPTIFPKLSNVNYLSADPGDFKLYERYNDKINWVFPNKTYEFYDFMVKSGRGKKDTELIKKYMTNKKIIDGQNGFDISFEFDINVPEYGIVNGEWWRSQFYEYLVKQQYLEQYKDCIYPGETPDKQELEEAILEKEHVKFMIDTLNFED